MVSNINPIKIYGIWNDGFALDLHTLSSEFIGYDTNGCPQFNSNRSLMGELMYQLKYKNDLTAADKIVANSLPFLNKWLGAKNIDLVIPAPYSHQRALQPVNTLAEKIANALGKTLRSDLLIKTSLGESKNQDKEVIIKPSINGFSVPSVLLVDDIFQTGATLNACVKVLKQSYHAKDVFVFCITKRRKTFVYV